MIPIVALKSRWFMQLGEYQCRIGRKRTCRKRLQPHNKWSRGIGIHHRKRRRHRRIQQCCVLVLWFRCDTEYWLLRIILLRSFSACGAVIGLWRGIALMPYEPVNEWRDCMEPMTISVAISMTRAQRASDRITVGSLAISPSFGVFGDFGG